MADSSFLFGQLLEAARAGSPEALGRVLYPWRRYLLVVAARELDPELRAKAGPSDVVQQTFLEAHRDFAQFRGGDANAMRLWLHRLLRNNVANVNRYYRTARRGAGREQPLAAGSSLSTSGPEPGVAADTLSPSGQAVANEQAQALAQALERLPEDYRRVITLRHLQGLSFDEIGNQMNRSANAAQLLWMRAIERMQQEMGVSS